MSPNGKDRLAAALGESYPRVWRGLGLESEKMGLNAYRQEKVGGEMTAPAILTEETLGLLSLGRNLFREPFDPHRK